MYHTVVYRCENGTIESTGFESRAKTKRGIIRAANYGAFWHAYKMGYHYRGECDIIAIDGNAI